MRFYRVTLPWAVCGAETNEDGFIIRCAPIIEKFLGESVLLLMSYAITSGGDIEEISSAPKDVLN